MSLADLCKQGDCYDLFSLLWLNEVFRLHISRYHNESSRLLSPSFSSVDQSSDRSFDVGMYTSLCVVACVAACIYSFQYRAHKASASPGDRSWRWQNHFYLLMAAGFVMMAMKSAFFCAWMWLRKNPDLLSSAKSSPLACNLLADVWTM